jgi:hypothetical protein
MDVYKKGPDGREEVERIDVEPKVADLEQVKRQNHGFAGPNEFVKTYADTHETEAQRTKRAPADGHLTAEIDPHDSHLKLPDHPRGEGWIEPDPSKPILGD